MPATMPNWRSSGCRRLAKETERAMRGSRETNKNTGCPAIPVGGSVYVLKNHGVYLP